MFENYSRISDTREIRTNEINWKSNIYNIFLIFIIFNLYFNL